MANFPPFQYQPQIGYQQPAYQQPTYQMPYQQQEQPLFCRAVTSREEALGVPVDFSGRPMTLLDTTHGKIWVKTFNPNTGSADLSEYRRVAPEQVESPAFVPMSDFQQFAAQISEEINKLKAGRRRANREEETEDV